MPRINHDELVRGISEDTGMSLGETARFLRATINRIKKHLSEMDTVRLNVLGEFQARFKEEHERKDTFSKSGRTYTVPRKLIPAFKFTEAARDEINGEIRRVV